MKHHHILSSSVFGITILTFCFIISNGTAFCPFSFQRITTTPTATLFQKQQQQQYNQNNQKNNRPRLYDTTLYDRLWERLEIEEDEEPMWYLLNCVAGLEMELLYQCREACKDLMIDENGNGGGDVIRFIVPTVKKTRSHGAKRMVTEHKVKYLGYVFAKLRLCKATYERIQSLDLCRSWMGTVNHKGYRKLPPSPLALNEDEIAHFGLEEWVDEEDILESSSMTDTDDEAILDNGEDDKLMPQVDTEAIKSFLGLKVDDMVKVTARNQFYNEDGVIRRLKDGKIMVRFLTYGTMFEEWLDPSDVRKLTELEALRGLSGPTQPITQRDLDGPARGRDYFDASTNPDFNRQQLRQTPPRNRRQDRIADRFNAGDNLSEQQNNDRNWNWYKEQKGKQQGSNQPWTAGSTSSGASSSDPTDKDWAMGDVDSQWGRRQVPPRQQRRNERTKNENRRVAAALDSEDDWSAFVSSSPSTTTSSLTETDSSEDDFFASLMSDLKKDLKSADKTNRDQSSSPLEETQDDDLFFDSLLDELAAESSSSSSSSKTPGNTNKQKNGNKVDKKMNTPTFTESEEDSLFFDSLLDELDQDSTTFTKTTSPMKQSSKITDNSDDDDFFAHLEAELDGALNDGDSSSDFFDQLESELSLSTTPESYEKTNKGTKKKKEKTMTLLKSEQSNDGLKNNHVMESTIENSISSDVSTTTMDKESTKSKSSLSKATSVPESLNQDGLSKCTVPVLKEMLRERGLKISGTKAELIDRLIHQ